MIKNKFLIGQKVVVIEGRKAVERFITSIQAGKDELEYNVSKVLGGDAKPVTTFDLLTQMMAPRPNFSNEFVNGLSNSMQRPFKESDIYESHADMLHRLKVETPADGAKEEVN